MTDEPGRKEQLSPARRELLRRRLARRSELQPPPGPQRGEAGTGPQPLSFAQERFWFLEQLEPGSADYSMTGVGRLIGRLELSALQRALDDLVARHHGLRMIFPAQDGVPRQQLSTQQTCELEQIGLEHVPPAERDEALREHTKQLHERGFSLSDGPLFRVVLMHFTSEDHGLALSMHHIVSDGWSLSVLLNDLAVLYNGYKRGQPARLPELAVSYADWAHWQRARLSGERLSQLTEHWREVLSGAPSHIDLPHDLSRPAVPGHGGATQHHELPAAQVADLDGRSKQLGATRFVILLAAFQAYLLRITGETDLVLGTSIANRDHVHLRQVVGPCLNTLALRTRCDPLQSFAELVQATRVSVHGALSHPELPFEKLVDALQPVRDPSRSPIFNVFFDMAVPLPEPSWDGIELSAVEFERGTALFDLALAVEDRGGTIRCALQFNTELFLPETAARLWHHFEVLLGSALSDPQRPLAELALLEGSDEEQLQQWADESRLDHDRNAWVHLQIQTQAAATPDTTALIEEGRHRSYGELDAAANLLAWRLAGLGAGPDVLVGVCLPRSSNVLVTILAIWKAGAVYLPLDPDDPPERLAMIADDARAPVIVTLSNLAERFEDLACELLFLDGPDDTTDDVDHRAAPPHVETSGEDLAYVIFTSGSTGEPKGVMIRHAALTNHIAWVRAAFDISPADRFVLRTPFSFDASLWEIVHPLVSGASLVVARPGLQRDPAALLALVADEAVTVLQTVPSMLRTWLDEPRFGQATALRHLICAGEALPPDLVTRFDERCLTAGMPTRLHNLYGPSEATIDATMHSCPRGHDGDGLGHGAVPIGRPVSNTAVHVLDQDRRLVPVGVVGELAIAGAGLAAGYLNRPDLTRKRFVPNPVGEGLIYLTGDLGKRLPDGTLEYAGRVDNQVKVNGFRIELGEIEAVLREHPQVTDGAVIADGPSGEQRRLLAYVVPRTGPAPSGPELREFLERRLPRYMLPAAFLFLDAVPRTSSEKLDRRALPRPETLRPELPGTFEPPVTPGERAVAKIVAELLEIDRVGLHDDFFALGGHSLLATRLSARLAEAFAVKIPLMDFFERPTVSDLAALVATGQRSDDDAIAVAPAQDDHPVSFGQQRLWFLSQLEPQATHYHMTGALRLRGALDVGALQAALDALIARHDALHTALRWGAGTLRQVLLPPASVTLTRMDLSATAGRQPQREALHDALDALSQQPFDLATAPLLRGALLHLGPDDHVLALCQHHIVSDGRSLQLLLNDLGPLYDAACRGLPSPLPPLPFGTIDHAHWQRQRLTEQRLRAELSWWEQTLAGAPSGLDLPTDHPRPRTPSHQGHLTSLAVSDDLALGLRDLASAQETTLFAVLAATTALWLSRLTGERDVVMGSAVDQRTRPELEPLLGFFVNILPLRLDLDSGGGSASGPNGGREPSFADLVANTQRTVGAALSHRELPFEHLVDQLAPDRAGSAPPLFNVSFDLLSEAKLDDALPGLAVEAVDYDPGTSKLDLAVAIEERGEALQVWIEASADLFEKDTVRRLWRHWETLAADLVAHPQRSIASAQLLSRDERAWLLDDCQPDATPTSESAPTLAQLISAAHEQPDATALIWGDQAVSYAELLQRVQDIAGQLASQQVGADALIALRLPRSPDQLACQLACWWIGASWLPLDVDDPPLRRQQLLNAAKPSLVVVDTASAVPQRGDAPPLSDAASTPGTPAVFVLDSSGERSSKSQALPPVQPQVEHAQAYVIFTSGSTGMPKGVSVSHGALTRVLSSLHEQLRLTVDDCMVQRIPWTFDASLQELLLPLWGRCPLVIATTGQCGDPDTMAKLVEEQGVTVLLGVPSFVGALLTRLRPGRNRLRLVGCGGEALPADMLTKLRSAVTGDAELLNLYGPTEATITAITQRYPVGAALSTLPWLSTLPLGRPLPGTQAHVVDEQGRLLPVGVVGELCLAGPCLATGYLHDPQATAAAFVSNPFEHCDDPGSRGVNGARLYHTGDMVRRLSTGALVFVGRRDSQVKVAGHRVELGEIEALLSTHPQVSGCAVGAVGQRAAELRLVAWVSREGSGELSHSALRQWLGERLPQAMVPSNIDVLDELPRTHTGKVDRSALLARAATPASSPTPSGESEAPVAELVQIFEELLGPSAAKPHVDFFAAGGHSLLAIELSDRIASRLGEPLAVKTIFDRRTPSALAETVHRRRCGLDELSAETVDLVAIAQLDPDVRPSARAAAHPPAEILLTGATGFLGAHLLAELMQHGRARVHCLVRAADGAAATQRVLANLRRFDLADGVDSSRIVALPGDLSAPRLGLDTETWERLANSLDMVLHNGAAVDFLQGYRALAGPNVAGTASALALAARAGAPLHFVSTLGVLMAPSVAHRAGLDEDVAMADLVDVEGGYEQTKWVAEVLVAEAGHRGLAVAIHRPGRIAGNTRSGHWAADDVAGRFLRGAMALGAWPGLSAPIDLSPVDWVAASIVHLALHRLPQGEVYHLVHPQPSSPELFVRAAERRGVVLDRVSPEEWRRRALEAGRTDTDHPLHLLLPLLHTDEGREIGEADMVPEAALPPIGSAFTQAALRDGPPCPTIDQHLIDRWLDRLLATGPTATRESPP